MTPLDLVRQWTQRMPGCYDQLDELRSAKEDMFWPDYCELPICVAYVYLLGTTELSGLIACWLWRKNKVIYRFDEDLTVGEIARRLGLNPNTTYKYLTQSIQQIRHHFEHH